MKPYGKHNIRATLYSLKKTWATQMDWYQLTGSTMNVETGVMETTWNVVSVRRAILLPDEWVRNFAYPLSFLAANKNFAYGDYYDRARRQVIVDVRDLPRSWRFDPNQPEFNDKIVIDKRVYQLWKAINFEDSLAYFLTLANVKGTLPRRMIPEAVQHLVNFEQEAVSV